MFKDGFNPFESKLVWGAVVVTLTWIGERLKNAPPQDTADWILLVAGALGVILGAVGYRHAQFKRGA